MYSFPINDVQIALIQEKKQLKQILFSDGFLQVNPNEISVNIQGVAHYHIAEGKEISIYKYPHSTDAQVQDQLHKWGTISILHQRKILNFHASSFSLDGKGIMILGDTGAGKSSVTAAISLAEGQFLNDDITAIKPDGNNPLIYRLGKNIGLLSDAVEQLKIRSRAKEGYKHEIELGSIADEYTPLKHIFYLSIGETDKIIMDEISGPEKFSLLRGNICNWEMLKGMPGLEEQYMKHLLQISELTPVTVVQRPKQILIKELATEIQKYLYNEK